MPDPILTVCDLRVTYGSGQRKLVAVDGISFEVPERGTLGLVGESGSGKSTVAKALVGLTPVASGTIEVSSKRLRPDTRRELEELRSQIQLVSQDPYSSLNPRMRIRDAIEEAMIVHRSISRRDRQREMRQLLDAVELSQDSLDRYPHEFSGGQRQRIALARALAARPRILVADEITSALDVSVQASVLNLLRSIQTDQELACLFISHNLAVVRYMCDSIAVMYLGRIIEQADREQLFVAPQHPYTRALVAAVPEAGRKPRPTSLGEVPDQHHPPAGCRYHPRCAVGPLVDPERNLCIVEDPQVGAQQRLHRAACHYVRESTRLVVSDAGPNR